MPVTPTLYNFANRRRDEIKDSVYSFLCCIQHDESPVSALEGKSGVQRTVAKYLIPPKITEDACHYKVKIDMCTGTEYVFVEALYLQGGWEGFNVPPNSTFEEIYTQEWSGSFSSSTFGGAEIAMGGWIKSAAYLKNEDGSYLTEGDLRIHFGNYMRKHFCAGDGRCGGKCCALPGDTIYWVFDEPYRVVTRWAPATDDELRERGWLHQGGLLYRNCELYREDPSQLDD